MTKYFYTDVTAAMYMAKNFGMRYYQLIDSKEVPVVLALEEYGRFYLYPDSYGILKPREGDIIAYHDYLLEGRLTKPCYAWSKEAAEYERAGAITLRDNKSFIMPEVEA